MSPGTNRELNRTEIRAIHTLVKTKCANYDHEYGCLLLDDNCPMMIIGFTNSALCKYFRSAVLPNEPRLQLLFQNAPAKICKNCGSPFPADGRRLYCSARCSSAGKRKSGAERIKRFREKQAQM